MPIKGMPHRLTRTARAVELLEKTDGMSIYEAARTVGVAYASVYKAVAKKRAAGLYKVCPCCKKSEIPERTPEDEYENF